jgi:hypothetical protein
LIFIAHELQSLRFRLRRSRSELARYSARAVFAFANERALMCALARTHVHVLTLTRTHANISHALVRTPARAPGQGECKRSEAGERPNNTKRHKRWRKCRDCIANRNVSSEQRQCLFCTVGQCTAVEITLLRSSRWWRRFCRRRQADQAKESHKGLRVRRVMCEPHNDM